MQSILAWLDRGRGDEGPALNRAVLQIIFGVVYSVMWALPVAYCAQHGGQP